MKGTIGGMISGWIPEERVESHHGRWFGEIVKKTSEEAEEVDDP